MFRIPAGTPVLLLATMLGGCTITTGGPPSRGTTYSSPEHSHSSSNHRPSANNNNNNNSSPRPNTPAQNNPAPKPPTRGYTPAPAGGVLQRAPSSGVPLPGSPNADVPRITAPFLFGNGDNGAFRGFAYGVPQGTSKLPDLSSMKPFAQMFVDSFAVSPRDFSGGFPGVSRQSEWFALRYEGKFLIRRQGVYALRLVADDGAILYIDGDKVVDNDGVHASESRTANRTLSPGLHTLRVDYLHTTGPVSLMVFIASDGNEAPLIGNR